MRTRLVLLSVLVTASTLTGCAASTPAFDPVACRQVLEIVAAMDGVVTSASYSDTEDEIDAYLDNAADAAGQLLNVQAAPDFSERIETMHDALQPEIEALREGFRGNEEAKLDEWQAALREVWAPVVEVCKDLWTPQPDETGASPRA